jgi:predicted dinucleotide-binding enzyme
MKLALIGAGNVGGTLGRVWASKGHLVYFGVRNPTASKNDDLRAFAVVGSFSEAVAFGEVIVLAVPGSAVAEFVAEFGEALNGKLVIDTTNNIRSPIMNSLAVLQDHCSGANLARAFSTLGWENFANPEIAGTQIDLFYCAQPPAKSKVETLVQDIGLHPVYIGDIDTADVLDGLTRLWFALAFGQNRGRRLAIKLLEE